MIQHRRESLDILEKSPTSQTTIFTTTARAVDSVFLVTNVQALTMCRRQYVQIRWYSIRSATDNRLLVSEQTGLTKYRHTGLPRYRHAGSPTRFQSGRPTLFHTGRPTLFHNGWATGLAVEVMVSMMVVTTVVVTVVTMEVEESDAEVVVEVVVSDLDLRGLLLLYWELER